MEEELLSSATHLLLQQTVMTDSFYIAAYFTRIAQSNVTQSSNSIYKLLIHLCGVRSLLSGLYVAVSRTPRVLSLRKDYLIIDVFKI